MVPLIKENRLEDYKRVIQPLVNIIECDKEIILEAEMPGLNKDDINVQIKNNELFIHAKSRKEEVNKGYTVIYRERCPYEYERKFIISDIIDKEKIEARYENGILRIVLHKVESAQPKKIEIKD